ncbi:hypothetical protein LJC15_00005 [Desulfovibrio sp. OttesenSCG-928-G11]|nr:hypothetical protein [Desulfovibrio sp. OttesenSCG-928-G11]
MDKNRLNSTILIIFNIIWPIVICITFPIATNHYYDCSYNEYRENFDILIENKEYEKLFYELKKIENNDNYEELFNFYYGRYLMKIKSREDSALNYLWRINPKQKLYMESRRYILKILLRTYADKETRVIITDLATKIPFQKLKEDVVKYNMETPFYYFLRVIELGWNYDSTLEQFEGLIEEFFQMPSINQYLDKDIFGDNFSFQLENENNTFSSTHFAEVSTVIFEMRLFAYVLACRQDEKKEKYYLLVKKAWEKIMTDKKAQEVVQLGYKLFGMKGLPVFINIDTKQYEDAWPQEENIIARWYIHKVDDND